MALELGAPPVLSTPDTHIFSETLSSTILRNGEKQSDEQLITRYEIQRTIAEIRERKWERVALQFPDEMLPDSARVFQLLTRGLQSSYQKEAALPNHEGHLIVSEANVATELDRLQLNDDRQPVRLTILADTSYGSCCVDEIAAEHVEADAVVHYGRACLSPTARLPVVYVFTKNDLELGFVSAAFNDTFPDKASNVIVTADITYQGHVGDLCKILRREGYVNIFDATLIHDPSSPIPNRSVPPSVGADVTALRHWHLFHISEPPTSLLLTLSSRVASVRIYPTDQSSSTIHHKSWLSSSDLILRRRYALITSMTTVSIWGILINTLSVKNYLHMVDHVRKQISKARKKSYLLVVGKLNAAKLANFSEIGGWVVIGCWESSLIDSKDFYKPVITPFELELALKRDKDRIWTGAWRADFQKILDEASRAPLNQTTDGSPSEQSRMVSRSDGSDEEINSDEESAPPEFDLRTGRYVSHSRPMHSHSVAASKNSHENGSSHSTALARKSKGDLAVINGVASPGAQYLQTQRTWQGLGSDFELAYEEESQDAGALVQEGRSGIARGYTVAGSDQT